MINFKRYITESNRQPKSKVPGLRYQVNFIKGVPMSFMVFIIDNNSPIVNISGGNIPIKDPEKFVTLTDKIFKKMKFVDVEINTVKLALLQKEMAKKLDVEFGETPEKSFHVVK